LGKLLIVAERNNSSDPDDNSNGGSLIFTFDYPVRIDEVQIVDIDDVEASGTVKAYSDAAGATLIATGKMLGLGDNSLQTVAVNARGVRRLEVKFAKSGGLAAVTSCRNQSLSTYQLSNLIWSDTNGNGLQDPGEPGIPGVELELYISGLSQIVARTTTNAGGEYFFPGLPAGSYTIKIASSNFTAGKPLAGASYSPANVGGAGAATATPTATFTPAPTATFTPTPVPPTATPASSNYCQVTYTVTNDWGNGFGTNVRLTNLTGSRWNDWTVTWSFDGNQQITNLWNGTLTQSGQAVQVRALSWNKKVNAGASVEFGFNGAYSGANPLPNNFRVNGNLCNGSGGGSSPTATPAPPTATPTATAGQGGGGSGPTPTPILLCTGNNPDVASAVTAMNQYNLITLDDLQNFGEVDARAFVGGNYSVSNWAQFGTHLGSTACSDRVLTVVGNIATNGINIQKGTIAVRTQPSSLNVNWNSGCGPNLTVDAALSDAQITAYMQNTAAALAGMTANNPAPTVSAGGDLVFNVTTKTPAGLAVFNVSGATVFSNNSVNGNIEFNNGAGATTILVNVSGASINWSRANMGNFLGSYNGNITKVIWNLHQATSFSTNSRRFAGALLAPYASVNAGSGNLEGSTVVKTLVSAGEIHDPVFSLANSTPLSAACQVVTPTPAPPTPTATPVPSVNDDTRDSDFIASTGKAPGIIVNIDNPTVDGGFILPPVGNPGPMSGVVNLNDNKGSQYEISLVGVSGTTWTYRVREVAGRDLSHWDLGIVNCLDKITSYSPTSGFASGTDGSTGFVGIKWDVAESFTDSTFSFTLNGDYQMSTVRALAKAGTGNAQIDIAGPDCSLPGTNPPSPTPMPTPGGTIGGGEGDTCAFGWLDWNGSVTSYLELQSNMNDTGRSGVWRMAEMIPPGPDVVANALVNSALDARKGSEIKIPLTHYNGSGYAICGFANVKLIDYRMEEGNVWLNLQFLQTLVNGVETNPAATDFGARDVRFKR
jgi:choice-of-anchor A domain-containing protein